MGHHIAPITARHDPAGRACMPPNNGGECALEASLARHILHDPARSPQITPLQCCGLHIIAIGGFQTRNLPRRRRSAFHLERPAGCN